MSLTKHFEDTFKVSCIKPGRWQNSTSELSNWNPWDLRWFMPSEAAVCSVWIQMCTNHSTLPTVFHGKHSPRHFCPIEFIRPSRLSCIWNKWMTGKMCVFSPWRLNQNRLWQQKVLAFVQRIVNHRKDSKSIFLSLFFLTCKSSKAFHQLDLNWVPITPLSIASMYSSISTSKGAALENWDCEC